MHDVFRAGVDHGGLTADFEIKMLICDLLQQLDCPFPVSYLLEMFVQEGIGNYFEAASAAASLVKSGHVSIEPGEEGERCYRITTLGSCTADTIARDLPPAIRERAVLSAREALSARRRRTQNSAEIREAEDGFLLTLTIPDTGSDLLSITILLPDKENCQRITERFMKDPVLIYKGVVAMLTGSFECVGPLLD